MKKVFFVAALILIATCAWTWDNPDPRNVPFKDVPKDRASTVTLEARRVKSVNGNTITYNLGHAQDITVRANSFQAERFIKDVERGRTTARQTVTLDPIRKSPFNRDFKANRR